MRVARRCQPVTDRGPNRSMRNKPPGSCFTATTQQEELTTESQRGPAATERSKAIRRFRRFRRFEKRKHLLICEICEICRCNSLHGAGTASPNSGESGYEANGRDTRSRIRQNSGNRKRTRHRRSSDTERNQIRDERLRLLCFSLLCVLFLCDSAVNPETSH
jgi:hypothetical protein